MGPEDGVPFKPTDAEVKAIEELTKSLKEREVMVIMVDKTEDGLGRRFAIYVSNRRLMQFMTGVAVAHCEAEIMSKDGSPLH